jgi:hypothetical protein
MLAQREPGPFMPAFDAPFPVDGWAIASAVDGTGAVERVIVHGGVNAGAQVDVAYACEQEATISITLSDARSLPVVTLFGFETACAPGEIGHAAGPSIPVAMPVNLEVGVDPAVRFWAKLGVPTDDLVR